MAQVGDTITYTHDGDVDDDSRLLPESEDISSVDTVTVDYCYSAGGDSHISNGGNGGAVENAKIDVSSYDTLYIFVSADYNGRYRGDSIFSSGGSTEITVSDTNATDSSDEPFLVGAGGGGSGYGQLPLLMGGIAIGSDGGGRGGSGVGDGGDGEGTAPPLGGDGAPDDSTSGNDGDGAIDDQNRGLVSDGTTIKGGGSPADTDGEVQITYGSSAPPTFTGVQITDASTEDELTLDWDEVADATSYNVYRAESSGSSKSDYTLVAEPTSPPYTDTGLEDGERYFYRVTSEN